MYKFLSQTVVFLWPALALALLGLLFLRYRKALRDRSTETTHVTRVLPLHKCTRRDTVLALIITLAYGVFAFLGIGDAVAPQTFHRFSGLEPSITIDLGGDVEISKIVYYTGSYHQKDKDTPCYTLSATSSTLDGFQDAGTFTQTHGSVFHWLTHTPIYDAPEVEADTELDAETDADTNAKPDAETENAAIPVPFVASKLRITTSVYPIELGELAIYGADGQLVDASRFSVSSDENTLFDEQDVIPDEISYMNSMYFDEIYHGRTAREFLNSDKPYENTHPPLGKIIISIGIWLFGMTPLGWRAPGVLFGVLMLPFFYVFVKNIFGKTWLASCATLIFAFDFMHFTQTRIATIDTYSVFFIILMYFFMYRFLAAGFRAPWKKQLVPLALAGLSFGLGAASKWTCIYAGGGLLVLLIYGIASELARIRDELNAAYAAAASAEQATELSEQTEPVVATFTQQDARRFVLRLLTVIGVCALFFLVLPALIYYASYYFFARGFGQELNFDIVWNNQNTMWNYHSALVATHPYQSSWYQWLVDGRPILYYMNYGDGTRTGFAAFLNPAVCWGGLMAVIALTAARYRNASAYLKKFAYMLCGVAALCTVMLILIDQSTAYEEPIAALEQFRNLPGSVMSVFAMLFITCVVGLYALPALSKSAKRNAHPVATFIIIAYFAQLLPWIPVSRCTFSYHYFPSVPFLVLALAWVFDRYDNATAKRYLPKATRGRKPSAWALASDGKRAALLFTAGALVLFALFYPVLRGIEIPNWYRNFVTHWLPSWPI